MYRNALKNEFSLFKIKDVINFLMAERRNHPTWFRTFGTCVFCGAQGKGKTLSAVQYVLNILDKYPRAVLVTNVAIKDRPFNAYMDSQHNLRRIDNNKIVNNDVILLESLFSYYEPYTVEYTGLDMLKYINNNEYGVVFLIDEIHLELNSLESQNIDIEVMVEISQQRKQRKHIVGTSQVYMRMAKPLREQIHDIILCNNFFHIFQYNKWIEGETVEEKNGKIEANVKGRFMWFHTVPMYTQYDTYTKMRRYNKEWKGRRRISNFYNENEVKEIEFHK